MYKHVQGFLAFLTLHLFLLPPIGRAQTDTMVPAATNAPLVAAVTPAIPVAVATGTPTLAENKIVMTAEQSTGGNIITLSGGIKAVTLDNTSGGPNTSEVGFEWKLASPLPAGWWRGTIEFGVREGEDRGYFNTHMQVMMMPRKTTVNLMSNFGGSTKDKDPQRFVFWIYSAEPMTGIRMETIYDHLWKYKHTLPITQCILERGQPSSLTERDVVTANLPVQPNGLVLVPPGMPLGIWNLSAALQKGGKAVIGGTDDRTFQVPGSSWFYIDSSLQKIALPPDSPAKTVVVQHKAGSPAPILPPGPPLMTTVDANKTETAQLEMIGANLTGDAPVFPLLPMGKKTAVLATWDDGTPMDLRMAELMHKLGFHPTFFMNQNSAAMKYLDKFEALGAEIGSHGYHHSFLFQLTPQWAYYECAAMRRLLEEKLKHPVISFAYPNGYTPAYDAGGDYVLRGVRTAGYWSGRTTWTGSEIIESIAEPMAFKTAGFFGQDKRSMEREWKSLRAKEGGIFLMWGHCNQLGSTEGQWKAHEDYLAKYANLSDAWYPSQGELFTWIWLRKNVHLAVTGKNPNKVSVKVTRPWLHPYLSGKRPLNLKVPAGVEKVMWQGKEFPVANGFVELPWSL